VQAQSWPGACQDNELQEIGGVSIKRKSMEKCSTGNRTTQVVDPSGWCVLGSREDWLGGTCWDSRKGWRQLHLAGTWLHVPPMASCTLRISQASRADQGRPSNSHTGPPTPPSTNSLSLVPVNGHWRQIKLLLSFWPPFKSGVASVMPLIWCLGILRIPQSTEVALNYRLSTSVAFCAFDLCHDNPSALRRLVSFTRWSLASMVCLPIWETMMLDPG